MKLYYVLNARFPNKKAYGIQAAKMCEAFIEAGVELTLVIPNTRAARSNIAREFYGLRTDIPTVILPGFDWYASGRVGFFLSSVFFMVANFFFLRKERRRGALEVIYSIDMDSFSFSFLPLVGAPVIAEMHGPKSSNLLTRFFFGRVKSVIATNAEIGKSIGDTFALPERKMLVEPNGVDIAAYKHAPEKTEARRQLGIPVEAKVALYVGRFFDWKALGILADAAKLSPEIQWYIVGGSEEEFRKTTDVRNLPSNLHVAGEYPLPEVPRWLAAADTLLILGTRANQESYLHTTPMKAFEYMAARRLVVAARTPALESFIGRDDVLWYEPDNAVDLAKVVRKTMEEPAEITVERAFHSAEAHSWQNRAARIIARIR